jgi:hypothetical protein
MTGSVRGYEFRIVIFKNLEGCEERGKSLFKFFVFPQKCLNNASTNNASTIDKSFQKA